MLQFSPEAARRIVGVGCGASAFASAVTKRLPAELWGIELERCGGILPATMRADFAALNGLTLATLADTHDMNFTFNFASDA